MAAAVPPPALTRTAPPAPAKPPSAPAHPAPPPPRPKVGELRDDGAVLHETVDAERWSSRGSVKVTGDVHIVEGILEGASSVGGRLEADAVRSQGSLDVEGAVDVRGTFSSSGTLHAGRTVHAGEGELRGSCRISGAVTVDRALSVRGSLLAPSVTAGAVTLVGEAEVPGTVTAGAATFRLTANSTFGTVQARDVTVHGKVPNLVEKVLGRRVIVRVRRVEAERADLEGVDVDFVHAPEIRLGRDAHVTEYEGTIVHRHPTSRVGFESKSPPPFGLRR